MARFAGAGGITSDAGLRQTDVDVKLPACRSALFSNVWPPIDLLVPDRAGRFGFSIAATFSGEMAELAPMPPFEILRVLNRSVIARVFETQWIYHLKSSR